MAGASPRYSQISAHSMPWTDTLSIIREDNAFRFDKEALHPEEAEALWAEFNVEMDRLYAAMNAGLDHGYAFLGAGLGRRSDTAV